MEINTTLLLVILLGALVTFIPRSLPLLVLSKMNIPEPIVKWLEHIPVAVMAALFIQEIAVPNDEFGYVVGNLRLLAALPTLLVAFITKSLLFTVLIGVVTMTLLRYFIPH
ncbi:AzlD domain-containing protein [Sporosarcina limicola]|uniref:Branched-subunit amino acid transport protein n=1 Tax=Sporosarcina limicola TaxID=34101 RepID=A0A927R7G7_9BACL|nr:AzlD domain-containing protein [Sporosarcina limicola]MBE1555974.1 branched-subunit amino acid transport protein [Sporosarcina limicola]